MEYKYDITVLIPVYNAEKTIEETLKSVLNQKNEQNLKIEILIVNDGSSDNSESICQQYAEKYENINYYAFENSGVSKTRNRGMDLAKGKYILFLDSDDLIDKNTIQENYVLFEQYYDEADILAYPLYKYTNNKIINHPRTKFYNETYLCDVDEYPHFNQSTMNVIIKNLQDKVYFEEDLYFAEDMVFNTNLIMRTGKVIVSSKGKYLYRTNTFSAASRFKSPVKAANVLVNFYLNLMDKYKTADGKVPKYVQSAMLYEINWRMQSNGLFPMHLSQQEYKNWEEKYFKIIRCIEPKVLFSHPIVDYYHRYYFFKNIFSQEKLNIEYEKNEVLFKYNQELILRIKAFLLIFTKFNIKNNRLIISGFIKEPLLELLKDIKLYFVNNVTNEKIQLNLYKSNHGYYKSTEYTNLFLQFDHEISLKEGSYKFLVEVNGKIYNTRYYFKEETIIKSVISKERRVFTKNYFIDTRNNQINISPNKFSFNNIKNKLAFYNRLKKANNYNHYLFKNNKVENSQKINLYSDRYAKFSEAYQLFKKNLKEKKDEQHYYIYKNGHPINLFEKMDLNERKNLVKFSSLEHKKLFLNADKIYTSSINFFNYSPFKKREYNTIAENFHFDLIWVKEFMNNGYNPRKYAKEVTNVDQVIVKSEKDKNYLITNYNYTESQISVRNENSNISTNKQKHILISFTWRSYLMEPSLKTFEQRKQGRFANSDYYKNLMALLNSNELNRLIKKGYKVDLFLHPYFHVYSDLFNFMNMNIKLLFQIESINQYDILISDYSSLLHEFELLGKETVKYHLDFNEFKCGNHIFKQLIDETDYINNHEELMNKLREMEGRLI